MASIAIVIIMAAVIASMGAAMYAYTAYQPNFVEGAAGEPVRVGPTEYIITYEGTFEGDKDTEPDHTFVKIGIVARNVSGEATNLSGGQFYLDDGQKHHQAVYGGFSAGDLRFEEIEPDKPVQRTTQFDIEFDKEERYDILIRPQKEQSSLDVATVCILNCPADDVPP